MRDPWSEIEIAAFIKGRLRGAEADRLATLLESDPAAQAVAERIGPADPSDATLRAAFSAPLEETPRAAARATLMGVTGKVTALPQRARPAWIPTTIAASLALALGFGAAWSLRAPVAPQAPAAIAVGPASGAVKVALETAPSGLAQAGLEPTATFRDEADRVCREFDALDADGVPVGAGVACHDEGRWLILILAAHAPSNSVGPDFTPATGDAADPIGDFLSTIGAGVALSPGEEAALIANGWR